MEGGRPHPGGFSSHKLDPLPQPREQLVQTMREPSFHKDQGSINRCYLLSSSHCMSDSCREKQSANLIGYAFNSRVSSEGVKCPCVTLGGRWLKKKKTTAGAGGERLLKGKDQLAKQRLNLKAAPTARIECVNAVNYVRKGDATSTAVHDC